MRTRCNKPEAKRSRQAIRRYLASLARPVARTDFRAGRATMATEEMSEHVGTARVRNENISPLRRGQTEERETFMDTDGTHAVGCFSEEVGPSVGQERVRSTSKRKSRG